MSDSRVIGGPDDGAGVGTLVQPCRPSALDQVVVSPYRVVLVDDVRGERELLGAWLERRRDSSSSAKPPMLLQAWRWLPSCIPTW